MALKDTAELCALQTARQEKQEAEKQAASTQPEKIVPAYAIALFNEPKQAAATNPSIDISQIGFEFSATAA